MASEGSVTEWIELLKAGGAGKEEAAQKLWERYSAALLPLARRHLHSAPRRVMDEEDVAIVAFERFCRAAAAGRFARLNDRDDLWQLLLMLTERAASNQRRAAVSLKRGGGAVRGESAFDVGADSSTNGRGLEQVPGEEPTPEFAAQVAEAFRLLLERLGDEKLRSVALLKFEGYSNEEIAERLGCSRPTVERRCARIRSLWQQE